MHFNLMIDLAGEHLTEPEADTAIGAMRGLSPVIGYTEPHPSLVVTLDAPDLRAAVMAGLDVVERATGRAATAVEAMSTAEFDDRLGL